MANGQQATIDYDALAKEHGGVAAPAAIDYDAIAKEHGGVLEESAARFSSGGSFGENFLKASGLFGLVDMYKNTPHSFSDVLSAGVQPAKQAISAATGPAKHLAELIDAHKTGDKEAMMSSVSKFMDSFIPGSGNANEVSEQTVKDVLNKNIEGVAGTATGLAAQGALAKGVFGEGGAIRSGWRKIGNPFGLASTGEELLTQGISPRTSLTKFGPSLEKAAGDLKAFDAQSPIRNVHDLNDAIPEIKQKIWSEEVEPALQRQATKAVDMKPVAEKVRAQVSDEMRTFDEANAEKLDKLADKLETAKDVKGANSLLKYINGQLESYFQKFPAARRANLMNNPETAGWEAARSELRNQFLNTLEGAGETGVRDARLRYGAFDTLQDAVERRVNVADRAKPMSLGRIVGLAAAVPTHGLGLLAGEISNYLNKPDVLIQRGIAKLPEPIRTAPFSPPAAANPLATVSPITGGALASPEQLFKSSTGGRP